MKCFQFQVFGDNLSQVCILIVCFETHRPKEKKSSLARTDAQHSSVGVMEF
jgi:hypothetical protein